MDGERGGLDGERGGLDGERGGISADDEEGVKKEEGLIRLVTRLLLLTESVVS